MYDEFPLGARFDWRRRVARSEVYDTCSVKGVTVPDAYHGHCHQKATKNDHHAVSVMRRAGYEVNAVDSSCCEMAGTFGYEAEHHAMSEAIGDILINQLEDSSGDLTVAPGASCRTQLENMLVERSQDAGRIVPADRDSPLTSVEMVAIALRMELRSQRPGLTASEVAARLAARTCFFESWSRKRRKILGRL